MEDLRVGVIGLGRIGKTHINRINNVVNGAKVTAVADYFVDVAKSVSESLGVKYFEKCEDLICSDEIDAIIVTTHDASHEYYVSKAIEAKKFVFCEKPLATTAEACKNIVDLEIAAGQQFVQVGYMRRYDNSYRQLKNVIDSKKLGEPLVLYCKHRNAQPGVQCNSETLISNSASHDIDVACWLLDDMPAAVHVQIPRTSKHHPDIQGIQIIHMQMRNGTFVDLEVNQNCQYGYDIRCEAICEEGTASMASPMAPLIAVSGKTYTDVCSDYQKRFSEAYDNEMQAWVDSIRSEKKVFSPNAWEGYVTAYVVDCATSARLSDVYKPVDLPDTPQLYKKDA